MFINSLDAESYFYRLETGRETLHKVLSRSETSLLNVHTFVGIIGIAIENGLSGELLLKHWQTYPSS